MNDEQDAATGVTTKLEPDNTQIVRPAVQNSTVSKIMDFLGTAVLVLFIAGFFIALFGGLIWLSESTKATIHNPPTTATREELYTYWKTSPDWIPLIDHYDLRRRNGVNNLAFYDKGIVRYNTFSIQPNDKRWSPLSEAEKNELTFTYRVSGSSVSFMYEGKNYILNVYQPFVLGSMPEKIFIVVPQGAIWWMDTRQATLNYFSGNVGVNPEMSQ